MKMNSHYLKYFWFMSSDMEPVYFIFKKKREEKKWIPGHWVSICLINLGCYSWVNIHLVYFGRKWHVRFIKFAVSLCSDVILLNDFPLQQSTHVLSFLHSRKKAVNFFSVLNGLLLIVLLYNFILIRRQKEAR